MRILIFTVFILLCSTVLAQEPQLSPEAPQDKPASVTSDAMAAFEAAIAPHIEEAKKTYPSAKEKFKAGLPDGQSFFVTTRLYDASGTFEQVFIAVSKIDNGVIAGRIWSDIRRVQGYKHGDSYSFPEVDILDWLITHPDGSEEGNFVGKFLDGYTNSGT
jgi:uncharacterized protein YegJ (DUF2314 family)